MRRRGEAGWEVEGTEEAVGGEEEGRGRSKEEHVEEGEEEETEEEAELPPRWVG